MRLSDSLIMILIGGGFRISVFRGHDTRMWISEGLAVTCLGHLARIHTRLDLRKSFTALGRTSQRSFSSFEDLKIALDDIKTYLGIDVKVGRHSMR